MHHFPFHAPRDWGELLSLRETEGSQVIAGGTDLLPLMRSRQVKPRLVIDLQWVPNLRFIRSEAGLMEIGSMTTHAELARSVLCANYAPLLADAARCVGSPQIRTRGTIGGNIATASPAGDTLPPLLVLGAELVLVSNRGERRVSLEEALLGPGHSVVGADEVVSSIVFPCLPSGTGSAFLKVGRRRAVAVSVASIALSLRMQDSVVREIRIAAGAVAPTPIRCRAAENELKGSRLDDDSLRRAGEALQGEIDPISDGRGTASCRRLTAEVLLKRAVKQAAGHHNAPE